MLLSIHVHEYSIKKFGHINSESSSLSFQNVSRCAWRVLFYLPVIIVFLFAQISSECQFSAISRHTLPRGKCFKTNQVLGFKCQEKEKAFGCELYGSELGREDRHAL